MASTAFMRYLAQQTEVEQQDNIDAIRRCFDSLLAEFPLSYGHWKRYADHEVRHGSCLLYTSPSPRDKRQSRMPSSA